MRKTIKFSITILVGKDTVGFHAFVPALKGLHTYGDSPAEAAENAADAAVAYIKSMLKHGEPIPIPHQVSTEEAAAVAYDEAFTKEITV